MLVMQVLGDKCFVNGTDRQTDPPAFGRGFPKHTLPYNGLITHTHKG